jgi:hypothetical protein
MERTLGNRKQKNYEGYEQEPENESLSRMLEYGQKGQPLDKLIENEA